MSSTKHPKQEVPTDADLKHNPGIGTSAGTAKGGDELDGDNTFEGDVGNDTTSSGAIDPRQTGRTNE